MPRIAFQNKNKFEKYYDKRNQIRQAGRFSSQRIGGNIFNKIS